MPLTPLQRKTLIRYNELRNRPIALAEIIAKALPPLLFTLPLATLAYAFVAPGVAYFAAGMGLGSALRQVALSRAAAKVLPALLAVIDWGKVAALLGESAPTPGPIDRAGPPA